LVTEPNRGHVDEVLELLQVLEVDEIAQLDELLEPAQGARRCAKRDAEAIVAVASR
jgi:hypothetical protein